MLQHLFFLTTSSFLTIHTLFLCIHYLVDQYLSATTPFLFNIVVIPHHPYIISLRILLCRSISKCYNTFSIYHRRHSSSSIHHGHHLVYNSSSLCLSPSRETREFDLFLVIIPVTQFSPLLGLVCLEVIWARVIFVFVFRSVVPDLHPFRPLDYFIAFPLSCS